MRFLLCLLFGCLCLSEPPDETFNTRYIYEITAEADPQGHAYVWTRRALLFEKDAYTQEEEAFAVFADFFGNGFFCVPEKVKLLAAEIENGCLILNVSEDILRYGGNAYERALVLQLMKTASSFPGIEYLTLLIEGESHPLTEGRIIYNSFIFSK